MQTMKLSELRQLPNLVSLSRIALIPLLGYYLASDAPHAVAVCVGLISLAGITDGLDGILARRLGQITPLGIALDPIADKIFAGALVILLVIFRQFPIWLASVIVGRDLIILLAGLILLKDKEVVIPSNLTGKYTFAALVVLLLSYVMRFDFGIAVMTWIALVLIAVSVCGYARVFQRVRSGRPAPVFADKPVYRWLRIVVTVFISMAWLLRFATDVLGL